MALGPCTHVPCTFLGGITLKAGVLYRQFTLSDKAEKNSPVEPQQPGSKAAVGYAGAVELPKYTVRVWASV
jgi:hypothetical protein